MISEWIILLRGDVHHTYSLFYKRRGQASSLLTYRSGAFDSTKTAKLVSFTVLPIAVDSGFGEDER